MDYGYSSLGGHELTRGSQHIIDLGTSNGHLYKTSIVFKNGTIHNTRIIIGMSNDASAGSKEFDVTFDNVYFDYVPVSGRNLGQFFVAWTENSAKARSWQDSTAFIRFLIGLRQKYICICTDTSFHLTKLTKWDLTGLAA